MEETTKAGQNKLNPFYSKRYAGEFADMWLEIGTIAMAQAACKARRMAQGWPF